MRQEQLKEIIESHGRWVIDNSKGERADLRYADLRYANLRSANLSYANLSSADLRYADLRSADLSSADLRSADLRSANLSYANLSSADLRSADLRSADLSSANIDKKYIQVSCIGSRSGMTTYCYEDDKVWCGCFTGTMAEFKAKVEQTHAENPKHLSEYRAFIAMVESLRAFYIEGGEVAK
jgi:hypothetical protein